MHGLRQGFYFFFFCYYWTDGVAIIRVVHAWIQINVHIDSFVGKCSQKIKWIRLQFLSFLILIFPVFNNFTLLSTLHSFSSIIFLKTGYTLI